MRPRLTSSESIFSASLRVIRPRLTASSTTSCRRSRLSVTLRSRLSRNCSTLLSSPVVAPLFAVFLAFAFFAAGFLAAAFFGAAFFAAGFLARVPALAFFVALPVDCFFAAISVIASWSFGRVFPPDYLIPAVRTAMGYPFRSEPGPARGRRGGVRRPSRGSSRRSGGQTLDGSTISRPRLRRWSIARGRGRPGEIEVACAMRSKTSGSSAGPQVEVAAEEQRRVPGPLGRRLGGTQDIGRRERRPGRWSRAGWRCRCARRRCG